MKVWLVVGGEYEQWFVGGIFSSPEKARQFCAAHKPGEYDIHADSGHILDDPDS